MRFILIALALLFPFWVMADEPRPNLPALYQVTGVAEDDVLNMRAGPDAGAAMIDAFTNDARDIQVIDLSLSGRWALVNTDEQAGWVAFRFLKRQPDLVGAAGLPASLQCFGTEPFWNLRIADVDSVVLTTPDGRTVHPLTDTSLAAPFVDLAAAGFRFTWLLDGQPVVSHILPGRCSDGMSDLAYGLHYIDSRLSHPGCCSL